MKNQSVQLPCQSLQLSNASTHVPKAVALLYRFQGYWRRHGFLAASRKTCSWLLGNIRLPRHPADTVKVPFDPAEEALQLQPGELVEVKSHAEIIKTLDPNGRHRGLLFMADMAQYCGRRMKVKSPSTGSSWKTRGRSGGCEIPCCSRAPCATVSAWDATVPVSISGVKSGYVASRTTVPPVQTRTAVNMGQEILCSAESHPGRFPRNRVSAGAIRILTHGG